MTHGHIVIEGEESRYELYTYHDGHLCDLLKLAASLPERMAASEFAPCAYRLIHLPEDENYHASKIYRALRVSARSGGISNMLYSPDPATLAETIAEYRGNYDGFISSMEGIFFYEWGVQGVARALTKLEPDRWFPVIPKEQGYPGPDLVLQVRERCIEGRRFNYEVRPVFAPNEEPEYRDELVHVWEETLSELGEVHDGRDGGLPWRRLNIAYEQAVWRHLGYIEQLLSDHGCGEEA